MREREIKTSLRNWQGEPYKRQRKTLKKYKLEFEKGRKHGKIYLAEDPDRYVTVSSTPSCPYTGRKIAMDIIRLLNGGN